MSNIRDIVDVIGRDRLAEALGLKNAKSIQPAIAAGEFPAAWYPVVKELGKEHGLTIPADVFKWKKPATGQEHTAA